MTCLTRRYRFSASHRLATPALSDEQNRELFGKCANPHGHGHNYILEVTVSGEVDSASGLVVRLGDLDGMVQRHVVQPLSHRHLNREVPEFAGDLVPTTENLAVVVHDRLRRGWPEAFPESRPALHQVRVYETKNNVFTMGEE